MSRISFSSIVLLTQLYRSKPHTHIYKYIRKRFVEFSMHFSSDIIISYY